MNTSAPKGQRRVTILIADDDADDRQMTKDAIEEHGLKADIRFVEDGEALLDYLFHRGKYADIATSPRPAIILLDLNMPKVDGREALRKIKGDPTLRQIPVVILTTSRAQEDIYRSYDTGASSFITKPVTFNALVASVGALGTYWFDIVDLPVDAGAKA